MKLRRAIEALTQTSICPRLNIQMKWGTSIFQNKICSPTNITRAITTTKSQRNIFKKRMTKKMPQELLSIYESHESKSLGRSVNKSKTLLNSPKDKNFKTSDPNHGVSQLLNSWILPSSKIFPYSRHPSRNSLSTPKESYKIDPSSNVIIQDVLKQSMYGKEVSWEELNFGKMSQSKSTGPVSDKLISYLNRPLGKKERLALDLSPSSGRSVPITPRTGVVKAFRLMETSCNRNRIRRDANIQRFHERPGLKRKRLKSQRWRQRFLDGFKATLTRVQELRCQGW